MQETLGQERGLTQLRCFGAPSIPMAVPGGLMTDEKSRLLLI